MLSRRNFLTSAGLGALLVGTDVMLTTAVGGRRAAAQDSAAAVSRALVEPWYRTSFIGENLMDERLIFYLGHAWYGMSDIGECLDTASRIPAGDIEAWRREWFHTADRVREIAETSLAGGHDISAGEAYFRASSYYQAGLIYMEFRDDPEMPRTARAAAECFEAGLRLLSIPGEPVQIPYEGDVLPAYYFRSGVANAPLLIFHQGMDANVEEGFVIAEGAYKRGYNCLMFHHPGQGLALREHDLHFRPDWEKVITPVIDYALTLPDIDTARIAVMGLSFGGSLVLRAAAYEHRMKIVIANPPALDWGGSIRGILFGQFPELEQLLDSDPDAFNAAIEQFLDIAPSYYRWWLNSAGWKYGQATPADLIKHMSEYSLEGHLEHITSRVLLIDGEAEAWTGGDGERVQQMLPNSEVMLFTDEDTGAMHNQTGAMAIGNQRLFDWLDDNL